MALVWQAKLPSHLKLALLAIADHANDDGWAYPGQTRLADKCGVKPRALRDSLAQLVDRGYLEVWQRHNTTNLYRVHATGGWQPAAVPGGSPLPVGGGSPLPTNHPNRKDNRAAKAAYPGTQATLSPDVCAHRPVDDTGYCTACQTQLDKEPTT